MTQDEMKKMVAEAALEYVEAGSIVGVGTGSTANMFIDGLAKMKGRIDGTVASSEASAERLRGHGIAVLDLNAVDDIPLYVDGADETNRYLHLVKGGGGALTREKIVAAVSRKFVCIADGSKLVDVLGAFPLPPTLAMTFSVNDSPLAGQVWRENFVTDNGNVILDVRNLEITDAVELEGRLNNIVGVVTNGLFARRPADIVLLGTDQGVKKLE